MYLGIDLGTSNSAVVGNRRGRLELFKTTSGEDVLPSVVMVDRSGARHVGRRAYEQMRIAPDGIAARFKRLLGTSSELALGTEGATIGPEEASAEVIGALLRQARAHAGDEPVRGTIVTVPAAFNQMQSEATIRAANAAGLAQVGLLQEPIAAAMACMENPDARDGLFLVYDLGGGTFDVALVRAVGGSVSVEAHEGINMLGGSDFDRSIVERCVMPWLKERFAVPSDLSKSAPMQRLLALAKAHVERAKIELSSVHETTVFVSEEEARTRDLDGQPVWLEVTVTREEVEAIVAPQIERSIELCRKVIADNGYAPEDFTRVVLIGGPSRMPIVRSRVPAELGIAVDHDIDPMTAVARGAAIYAESREWAEPGASAATGDGVPSGKQARVRRAGDLVEYDFEARTTGERGRIRVIPRTDEANDWRVRVVSSTGQDYGERVVGERPVFAVHLDPGETEVALAVFDPENRPVPEASATLTLTRVMASASGAPCTATIAVKVEDTDGTRSINVLEPLIDKGEILPKRGERTFRAARKIEPGSDDWIDVELYEQAPEVPEPEANLLVGSFRLTGRDLPAHAPPLMPGDEVVLHWRVDDNQLIRASVELPRCGLHLRDHSFYVDDLAKIDFGRDGRAFAGDALMAAESDYHALQASAGAVFERELAQLRRRLDDQTRRLREYEEADVFRSITEEARLVRQEISRLRHKPQARERELSAQIYAVEQRGRALSGDLDRAAAAEADGHLEMARRALEERQFQLCERAIKAAESIFIRAVVDSPGFISLHFMGLRQRRYAATDKAAFDQLVDLGEAALRANDDARLRQVVSQMHGLLADAGGQTGDAAALAGLRRG